MKKILLSLILMVSIFAQACTGGGPLSKLDSTLDYAPLFFQGLVISGKITQSQADSYKRGIVRFEAIAENTKSCLSADVKSDAVCYLDLGNDIRVAVGEYYPAVNDEKISQYISLVNDIVQLIIRKNVPTVGGPLGAGEDIDKSLDAKINELDKLLKNK